MKFPPFLSTPARMAGTALLAAAAALSARADYQSTVLSQGPVGYWRLNETTQPGAPVTTAANQGSLGAGENGTYEGSQGFFRGFTGALSTDTAIHFDGSSQDVNVPYNAALNPAANFSVEGWFKADANAANCAISCGVFGTVRSGWLIYQTANTGYEFRMYNGVNSSFIVDVVGNAGNVVGVWTHVVATFDGTTARLYLNGTLAGSSTLSGTYAPGVAGSLFTFGMRADAGFRYAGGADEVAFYGSVLSASDIATHYSTATSNPNNYPTVIGANSPLVYFRCNEPGNPSAANLGTLGAAGNGEYSPGTRPGVVGPRSTANYAGFDGANNAVGVSGGNSASVPALNLNTNTVTITGWLNLTNPQTQAAGIVFCRAGTTVAGLTMDQTANGFGYGLGYNWGGQGTGWSPFADSGMPLLPDSDWAFVALIITPSQATIAMCDRTNVANFASVTFAPPGGHANMAFGGATQLGVDPNTTPVGISGALDEVAIFGRSLTLGEVYTEYASAVGGVPAKIFADPQTPPDPIYTGDTFSLTVDAGGTPNLNYQWRKDGGNISGATTSTYTKNSASAADNGNYDCVVNNTSGSATSGPANITITPAFPPAIVTGPSGHVLYPGGTLNLTVVATGGGLRYLWSKNGSPISGATTTQYRVASVTPADTGSYSVLVTNSLGQVTGGPVTVTVRTPSAGYETVIVASAPESWWRLNETSGTTMFDSMGRHDGIYSNFNGTPVTLGLPGAVGGSSDTSVSFDGTSVSYGYVPYAPILNNQSFTLECWVKTSVVGNANLVPVSSENSAPAQGDWFWAAPSGSQWSGGVGSAGNNYYVPSTTTGSSVVAGSWTHLVMTYDPGTALRVYFNGQWDNVAYVNFDRNTAAPFLIGALSRNVSPWVWTGNLFNGQVDEVLYYTRAITLAEATNHYALAQGSIRPFFAQFPISQEVVRNPAATVNLTSTAGGSTPLSYQWYKNGAPLAGATAATLSLNCDYSNAASYFLRVTNVVGVTNSPAVAVTMIPNNPPFVNVTNGLVLHLKFDGNYSDSSGRGNNGTAVGANLQIVSGRLGSGALFFYTSNSIADVNYLTLGHPTDLNFGASQNFSVAYWVKYQPMQTNGDLPFLCSAVNSWGNPGFTFAPSYKEGGWSYSLNGNVQLYGPPNTINDGNWHHLLHTFDRNNYAVTYLDGVQVDSRLDTGAGNLDTGNAVTIGQDPTGLYAEDGSATIDDMAVWRRSLSAAEAFSVYYAATNSNLSFDTPGKAALSIARSGSNLVISWVPGATLGTLLQADSPTGPWTPVSGVYSPSYLYTPTTSQKYFRLQSIE